MSTIEDVAVVFAPFQIPTLEGTIHQNLLRTVLNENSSVVVALPVRKISPSKSAPLDFSTRHQMISKEWEPYWLDVVGVPDKKYAKDQVTALESAVLSIFSNPPTQIYLYCDQSFAKLYQDNGGKWQLQSWTTKGYQSGISQFGAVQIPISINAVEADYRAAVKSLAELSPHSTTSGEYFRAGVISAMQNQFPISWPTVDMAICRKMTIWLFLGDIDSGSVTGRYEKQIVKQYLFGKKPGEIGWRFPGGFKDRTDPDFETAVLREAGEEVLVTGVKPNDVFEAPKYITSRNVNDWRYRNDPDGITTHFYQLMFKGTDEQIKANDDLVDTNWFSVDGSDPSTQIDRESIEGEHKFLYDSLVEWEKKNV